MTSLAFGPKVKSGVFTYAGGNGFTTPSKYLCSVDLNGDGLDEVIFAGFETQPNSPSNYTNTNVSIFGWSSGKFANLTSTFLPNNINKVQAVADVVYGDFNNDGRTDFYVSGDADMDYQVHSYAYINKGSSFERQDLGLTSWEHGASVGDINNDGYDDVVIAAYLSQGVFYLGGPSGLTKHYTQDAYVNSYETNGSGIAVGDFLGNGTATIITSDSAPANGPEDTRLQQIVYDDEGAVLGFNLISTLPIPRLELSEFSLPTLGYDKSHDIRVRAFDFTRDGLQDALVFSRAGWDGNKWPNVSQLQFLENRGGGNFVDVTSEKLIGYESNSMIAYMPVLQDFNSDGLLDIFLSEVTYDGIYQSTTILLAQEDGAFVDTGRQQLSSCIQSGGVASIVKGPNGNFYMVVQSPEKSGAADVSTIQISFTAPTSGTSSSDILNGGSGSDVIYGGAGNDNLYGMAGNDRLYGAADNDTLNGGAGVDIMLGGAGNDTYFVDNLLDRVYETTSISSTDDALGLDTVVSSVSWTLGSNFENLTLSGTSAIKGTGNTLNNVLIGNAGANNLNGGAGNDTIFGGSGNDSIYGDIGNDMIFGGAGKDILFGGAGSDVFGFNEALSAANVDTIKDFAIGTDKIALDHAIFSAFAEGVAVSSDQFSVVSSVANLKGNGFLTYCTANDTLYYDSNGLGTGDLAVFKIELTGTSAPTASDFVVI